MLQVDYVVTIYNKSHYLPYVLASLVNQKGDFQKKFIFIDDGSTDDSCEVIRDFFRNKKDQIILISQTNQGPAVAMNRGLEEVTGDFVKPLDGDDVLLPNSTLELLVACQQSGCNLAFADPVVQGRYNPEDKEGFNNIYSRYDGCENATNDFWQIMPNSLRKSLRNAKTTPSAWLSTAKSVKHVAGCDDRIFIQDYSVELRMAFLGDFVKISTPVFLAPDIAPDRLSDNEAQTLHDINLAVANLIEDYPSINNSLKKYALSRTTARAARWLKNHGDNYAWFKMYLRNLAAKLGFIHPTGKSIRYSCKAFTSTSDIRKPVRQA